MHNSNEWCYAWFATTRAEISAERAALIKSSMWSRGTAISVSFLDGSSDLQKRVMNVAQQWTLPGLANLLLNFHKNTNRTDIRISFKYTGSWSTIGTTCKNITNLDEPTMNFGWLTENSSDEELERVVLHEFGHAFGLTHEHLKNEENISWNREQVIKDLSGPPNIRSLEEIEANFFLPFNKGETNFRYLNSESIMVCPIPEKWTLNGYNINLNPSLSKMDKIYVKGVYP